MITRQKIGPALSVFFALAANQAGACGLTPAETNANEIKQIAEEIRSGKIDSVVTSAPECKQGELRGNALIVSTPAIIGGIHVLFETIVMPRRVYSQARTLGEAKLPPVDLRPLESALRARGDEELKKLLEQCPKRSQSAKAASSARLSAGKRATMASRTPAVDDFKTTGAELNSTASLAVPPGFSRRRADSGVVSKAAAFIAVSLAVTSITARAEPPPNADPRMAPFFQGLKTLNGTGCCSVADCREVLSKDPTQTRSGKWEVLITKDTFGFTAPNNWVVVPDNLVNDEPTTALRPIGAIVCWNKAIYKSGQNWESTYEPPEGRLRCFKTPAPAI